MARNTISEWSSTASSNTDVGGINIAEGCQAANVNNALREIMAQIARTGLQSFEVADVDALLASTETYDAGSILVTAKEGFAYEASDASSDVVNAGGQNFTKLRSAFTAGVAPMFYRSTTATLADEDNAPTDADLIIAEDPGTLTTYRQYDADTYSDSPQTFDLANGQQAAVQTVHYPAAGLEGVYTARFGHRAGDLQYQIFSSGYARLLSDIEIYKPRQIEDLAFRVKYVDGVNGDDANDGESWATANKTIRYALNQSACDILYVTAGVYYEASYTWDRVTNLSIIGVGGQVEIVYGTMNTDTYGAWSTVGGSANVRELAVTAATATGVFDRQYNDERGPKRLVEVGSLSECNSTPNSWYQASAGSSVFVNREDNGGDITGDEVVVGTDNDWVFQFRAATTAGEPGPVKVFMKNITIWGGQQCLTVEAFNNVPDEGTVFFTEDCRFFGCSTRNNLRILDIGLSIHVRTGSSRAFRDGFNYTANNGQSPHGIEVDCFGHDNGWGGESNTNGSTAHDNSRVLRINSQFTFSRGPQISDIDTSKTWNVCCLSRLGSTSNLALTDSAEAWVHGGYYEGAREDVNGERRDLRLLGTSTMHLKAVTTGFPAYAEDAGTSIDGTGW